MNDQVTRLPPGPVMLDVAGLELTPAEAEMLRHPLVGGVILFARNYQDGRQLRALTAHIHALREPALLIAVDHEGGRVQRFRDGFTRIPSMGAIGRLWRSSAEGALETAEAAGRVLAAELVAHGVDLSFAPVLDLDYGCSRVIGDRAFHSDPEITAALADAFADGLADGGMAAVGKHFPGHGFAEADSHVEIPRDGRAFEQIWARDMLPYRSRIGRRLDGVMPAHVIYSTLDPSPAGFSRFWLQDVLRGRIGFSGTIFSDDLTMEGATVAGGIVARAGAAVDAGCDMVLVCNRPDLSAELLDGWRPQLRTDVADRVLAMRRPSRFADPAAPDRDGAYLASRRAIEALTAALA
ncbi:MAG: beta-N-acetylhexosaminidase [Rhodocyclaceae bacterium]|nr:beta-N-acetylhexosaminidase [Rhodocyclaceae bacterium]